MKIVQIASVDRGDNGGLVVVALDEAGRLWVTDYADAYSTDYADAYSTDWKRMPGPLLPEDAATLPATPLQVIPHLNPASR